LNSCVPVSSDGTNCSLQALPQIALGYGGLAIAATVLTLLGARNPHIEAMGNSIRGSSDATGSPMRGALS
jgi:hypothetical protein